MSASRQKRAKLVEHVAAAIEGYDAARQSATRVFRNAKVRPRAGAKKHRQVDVVVEVNAPPRTFRAGIEVKAHKRLLTLEAVEQLQLCVDDCGFGDQDDPEYNQQVIDCVVEDLGPTCDFDALDACFNGP